MRLLRYVLAEIAGLFVDDMRFSLLIVVWILLVWLVMPRFGIDARWRGLALGAGLMAFLGESALRAASKARR